MSEPRPLVATYRLQLVEGFGFDQAAALVPYFKSLGISHLYLSPILEAAKGSTHGYDVIDHGQISNALGGAQGFARLAETAQAAGLGLILDIVPNHMSISDPNNRWWWDVLENGRSSIWAHAFDVDWNPPEARNQNTVMMPVLGDRRTKVLERREVSVAREGGRFIWRYFGHRLPVAPRSIGYLLQHAAQRVPSAQLAFLADAFVALPRPTVTDSASVARRHRDKEVLRELLDALVQRDATVAAAVDATLQQVNTTVEMLDSLLELQNFRLAYWRAAERELDYRRFFDINSLVGLKMEDRRVFEESHQLIGTMASSGLIDGVRVDHVDGLADPAQYLERLRALAPRATIHVEKILGPDEQLKSWPIDGTTGYEFITDLTQVSLPPSSEAVFRGLHRDITGTDESFESLAVRSKQQVLKELLASDVNRLTQTLMRMGERYHELRDYSRHDLREAVTALAASFPVYRTYVVPQNKATPDEADRAVIRQAVEAAKALVGDHDPALFDFLQELMLQQRTGALESDFIQRFQQLSAPTMAKGVEDTAFYRDARLLVLSEVGGEPARWSLGTAEFHRHNQQAQAKWPRRLLASSTHDTKRSEDVRARLVAMAQRPQPFVELAEWFMRHTSRAGGGDMPAPRLKYTALQTMVGAWPLEKERLHATLLKSAREAKLFTFWTKPNEEYEKAIETFCATVLADEEVRSRLDAYVLGLQPLAQAISLGWTLLKSTSPGVPDFYQGTELWNLSLVDPDNRRPVDWPRRLEALNDPRVPSVAGDEVGLSKLHVIKRALAVRRQLPEAFGAAGTYQPLEVSGEKADRVIAFARLHGTSGAVTVVSLRPLDAGESWGDTSVQLPSGAFAARVGVDRSFSGTVKLSEVLGPWPVELLATRA